jgi:hypothetical protein
MIRHVRHFATRLRRGDTSAHSASTSAASHLATNRSAWDRFDEWLGIEPITDAQALRERELAHEHARVTFTLLGQAGATLVSRIVLAREEARLVNDDAARFTLKLACARGNPETRTAACAEVSALA